MACPICEKEKCDELIVDLLICDNCSHIFKKEPINYKTTFSNPQLHLYKNPISTVRWIGEHLKPDVEYMFKFPSMIFYSLDISPNDFYNSKYNHFFNQMSLNILLKRCGLKIITQNNQWSGSTCETILKVIKE